MEPRRIIEPKLMRLLETARGFMEPEHTIELLTFLCLVAKEEPTRYQQVQQLSFSEQRSVLAELGADITRQHDWPEAIGRIPDINKINPAVMSIAVTLAAEQDYLVLSQLLWMLTERMGKRGWTFNTNQTTLALFSTLIGDCSNKTLYDGAGGVARIVSALKPKFALLEEISSEAWTIAFRLLLLEGRHFEVINADALSHDLSDEYQADMVVMKPPFGLRFTAEQRRSLAQARYLQVPTGDSLPASAGDVLWIQKAISMLNPEGEAYILFPQGWLFRGGYDAKVRDYLLEHGLVKAIIGLPAGILDFTGIPPVLAIFKKKGDAGSPVTFIDASEMGSTLRSKRRLTETDTKLIKALVEGQHSDDPRYCAVELTHIQALGNNLSIQNYIKKKTGIETLSIREEFKRLAVMQEAYDTAHKELIELLHQFGQ